MMQHHSIYLVQQAHLRIQVFWEVILSTGLHSHVPFKGGRCLHPQGSQSLESSSTLLLECLYFVETMHNVQMACHSTYMQ